MHGWAEGFKRAVLPALMSALVVAVALSALGPPDPAGALDFAAGRYQTTENVVAAIVVVLWGLIGVLVSANAVSLGRGAAGALGHLRRRRQRAFGMLAIGFLALTLGLLRQADNRVDICCGSLDEARQLVR